MKTEVKNQLLPMEDRPAEPLYIKEQHNHNCQQFYGPVTGCVFAMPGAQVYQQSEPRIRSASESATCNPQLSTDSILEYVMRLHPDHVREEWRDKYPSLWERILELPSVASKVYNKGKQQGTTFNRSLVGNILHLLAERKVLATANATKLAQVLEGDANASVRGKLGEMPEKEIRMAVEEMIDAVGEKIII
jgi:hypothetical protein